MLNVRGDKTISLYDLKLSYKDKIELKDIDESLEVRGEIKIMEEYVDESQYVLDDDLLEAYDKEKALIEVSKDAGREEGKEERNKEIAIKMLNENLDINLISKITNLSIDEINNLTKNDQN